MKRTLAIIAALGLSTAVSGCFFSSDEETAAVSPQPQSGPAWKLTLKSECADASTDFCVAAHGFSVTADGKYQMGPTPRGQVASGMLSEEEFKLLAERVVALSTASASESGGDVPVEPAPVEPAPVDPVPADPAPVEPAPADPAPAPVEPAPAPVDPAPAPAEPVPAPAPIRALTVAPAQVCQASATESQDTLTLTRDGQEMIIAQGKDFELCFQASNIEAAAALHEAIRVLAAKYYVLPFPDSCADSVSDLHNLYATVQSCTTDADCAYMTLDYQAIPASGNQFVVTDSCTLTQPLVVGNISAVLENRNALLNAANTAYEFCGGRLYRCGTHDGFMSGVGAPTCQQGVCRISATIGR